jgi:hypothetical protein
MTASTASSLSLMEQYQVAREQVENTPAWISYQRAKQQLKLLFDSCQLSKRDPMTLLGLMDRMAKRKFRHWSTKIDDFSLSFSLKSMDSDRVIQTYQESYDILHRDPIYQLAAVAKVTFQNQLIKLLCNGGHLDEVIALASEKTRNKIAAWHRKWAMNGLFFTEEIIN